MLKRLDAFLPEMKKANDELNARLAADPAAAAHVDVEVVDDEEAHVAMELHCGVFEEKNSDSNEDKEIRLPNDIKLK